jgi:hypothetical protein
LSEILDQLAVDIKDAQQLPLEEQPAAFESIRQRLEAMIADSRAETE